MALFVVLGGPEHKEGLEELWTRVEWTINKNARIGERVVFYLTAPISALVATGVVSSKPKPDPKEQRDWVANIKDVEILPRYLLREELMRKFPSWKHIKMPIKSKAAPDDVIGVLEKLIEPQDGDGDGESEFKLGGYVEFKSKTRRKPMTGTIKEVDEDAEMALVLRDDDLKTERIEFDQVRYFLTVK